MTGWRSLAACAGRPDLFFGPDGEHWTARARREAEAQAICARCPVRSQCSGFAVAAGAEYGVWGMTESELRARLSRPGRAGRHRPASVRVTGPRGPYRKKAAA